MAQINIETDLKLKHSNCTFLKKFENSFLYIICISNLHRKRYENNNNNKKEI